MSFADCIREAHAYLEQFDYDRYPLCFAQFEEAVAPFFAGLEWQDAAACAAGLIAELSRLGEGQRKREQRALLDRDRQVLALFLTPAARRHGDAAAAFAEVLREQWNRSYPRAAYLGGDFESILKGFDANLLGLPLRKSSKR